MPPPCRSTSVRSSMATSSPSGAALAFVDGGALGEQQDPEREALLEVGVHLALQVRQVPLEVPLQEDEVGPGLGRSPNVAHRSSCYWQTWGNSETHIQFLRSNLQFLKILQHLTKAFIPKRNKKFSKQGNRKTYQRINRKIQLGQRSNKPRKVPGCAWLCNVRFF